MLVASHLSLSSLVEILQDCDEFTDHLPCAAPLLPVDSYLILGDFILSSCLTQPLPRPKCPPSSPFLLLLYSAVITSQLVPLLSFIGLPETSTAQV